MKTPILALASAALLALAAAPAMAGPNDWTGPYVGANVGVGFGSSKDSTTVGNNTYFASSSAASVDANGTSTVSPTGFTGGLGAGFNQQNGAWVIGVEGDIGALSLNKTATASGAYPAYPPTGFSVTQGVRTSWLFTLRPRVGVVSGNVLLYGTGGLAMTDVQQKAVFTDTYEPQYENGDKTTTRTGWTIGGGAETVLSPKWTMKAEYLYADFGKVNSSGTLLAPYGGTVILHAASLNASLVRFGVNMRF
jgi:outer membrane immunogenic protein